MQIGMVGLGRMGGNMARRLMAAGHECVVFDLDPKNVAALTAAGATGSTSLADFARRLAAPRAVWIMVPSGDATDQTVNALGEVLERGDAIIDGGNSYFKDDVRRAHALLPRGIHYIDVGTSGGVWGLERGYCLMIGGDQTSVQRLDPIFRALAPGAGEIGRTPGRPENRGTAENGYLHCGPVGSGHFVKMIHNGIEYGMMQAYAEGFDILLGAGGAKVPTDIRYSLDIPEIAELWRRGSVVGSWLLDLTATALVEDPKLDGFEGHVPDSGEGRWTVMTAVEQGTPISVLADSLFTRFRSRQTHTFGEKVLSAMRAQFGGHRER